MFPTRFQIAAAVLLTGAAVFGQRARADDKPAKAATDFARIDQLVQEWEMTAAERRIDDIGWATDLREALRLARDNQRPVFLFTYSGEATEPNAIALRRC